MRIRFLPYGKIDYQFDQEHRNIDPYLSNLEPHYNAEFLLSNCFYLKNNIQIGDFNKDPENNVCSIYW